MKIIDFGFNIGVGPWIFQLLITPFRWWIGSGEWQKPGLMTKTVVVGPLRFTVGRETEENESD